MIKTIDPLTNSTSISIDRLHFRSSVTDARSLTTKYQYDTFWNVYGLFNPGSGSGGNAEFDYDGSGNLVKENFLYGSIFRSFDALNRVKTVTLPVSTDENIAYSYDSTNGGNFGIGRLTGYTDETGSTALVYNERGDVISTTRTIGGHAYTTAYGYDIADNVTNIIYPSGHVIGYGRDSVGRINLVTYRPSVGGAVTVLASNISYAPFGPMTGLFYGNGLARSMAYDFDYRLTNITTTATGNNVQNLGMAYDAADNITAIFDGVNKERSQTFAYDKDYRLKQATGVYGVIGYSYDGVGNRLSRTTKGIPETYTYSPDANRLQSVTSSGKPATLITRSEKI